MNMMNNHNKPVENKQSIQSSIYEELKCTRIAYIRWLLFFKRIIRYIYNILYVCDGENIYILI